MPDGKKKQPNKSTQFEKLDIKMTPNSGQVVSEAGISPTKVTPQKKKNRLASTVIYGTLSRNSVTLSVGL